MLTIAGVRLPRLLRNETQSPNGRGDMLGVKKTSRRQTMRPFQQIHFCRSIKVWNCMPAHLARQPSPTMLRRELSRRASNAPPSLNQTAVHAFPRPSLVAVPSDASFRHTQCHGRNRLASSVEAHEEPGDPRFGLSRLIPFVLNAIWEPGIGMTRLS